MHIKIKHHDWFQYKEKLPALKKVKKVIQQTLKPGQNRGGTSSSNIGIENALEVS